MKTSRRNEKEKVIPSESTNAQPLIKKRKKERQKKTQRKMVSHKQANYRRIKVAFIVSEHVQHQQ